jgi:hypothetical protein
MRTRLHTNLISVIAAAFVAVAPSVAPAQTSAPAATPATPPAQTNPDDVIRCRSMEVTGSLARRERVCKTVGEWRRLADRGNDNAREIIDHSRGRPSGM